MITTIISIIFYITFLWIVPFTISYNMPGGEFEDGIIVCLILNSFVGMMFCLYVISCNSFQGG